MRSAEWGVKKGLGIEGQGSVDNDKELNRAKNAAYRFLTYRARSRSEIIQKLRDKGFDAAVIEAVIADLMRFGYINDREFSRQWASSRIRLRGFGRRRIEQELRNKGINRDIIHEIFGEVFQELSEADIARREAEKKRKSLTRFGPEIQRRRLAGFLERRGFSAEIIRSVINAAR